MADLIALQTVHSASSTPASSDSGSIAAAPATAPGRPARRGSTPSPSTSAERASESGRGPGSRSAARRSTSAVDLADDYQDFELDNEGKEETWCKYKGLFYPAHYHLDGGIEANGLGECGEVCAATDACEAAVFLDEECFLRTDVRQAPDTYFEPKSRSGSELLLKGRCRSQEFVGHGALTRLRTLRCRAPTRLRSLQAVCGERRACFMLAAAVWC